MLHYMHINSIAIVFEQLCDASHYRELCLGLGTINYDLGIFS